MRQRLRFVLNCQTLESRALPAATDLSGGMLMILGSSGPDSVAVTRVGSTIRVNGTEAVYVAEQVRGIAIDAGEGDDIVSVASNLSVPVWMYGGGGNDRLEGGAGTNYVFGGAGADTLIGGAGSDQLYGGGGNDQIHGGGGLDTVFYGKPERAANPNTFEQQIIDLTNQARARYGLPALRVNGRLTAAAQLHAQNMAERSAAVGANTAMAHTLTGVATPTVGSRAAFVGLDAQLLGENVAYGYSDAAVLIDGLMASSGHRANILNPQYTQIGVGVRYSLSGVPFISQDFSSSENLTTPINSIPPSLPPPAPPESSLPAESVIAPGGAMYAVGADAGAAPRVVAYDAGSGRRLLDIQAYASGFLGGVRVATGDVNGDSVGDVITAAGPGGGPHVRAFDGRTGAELFGFMAYDPAFSGGVFVASADVNGDRIDDIITGADAGGGPHVRVFDGRTRTELAGFFAYSAGFRGGVRVAAADVNGDRIAEIITGAGAGGGPHVRIFDSRTAVEIRGFFAFDLNTTGGVFVAAGDLTADGLAEVVTSSGPRVRTFDGQSLARMGEFFAYDPFGTSTGRVGIIGNLGDARPVIGVAPGPGNTPDLRRFDLSGRLLAQVPSDLGGAYIG
jgi:hypothetical protein